jgi:internalin A
MKTVFSILLVLVLLLGVSACSGSVTETPGTTAPSTVPPSTVPTETVPVTEQPGPKVVVFKDDILEARVRANMEKPTGDILVSEAEEVTYLDLSSLNPGVPHEEKIKDISALARFKNLGGVNMNWNAIADLSPLAELTNLEALYLEGNDSITDFSPLAGLTNMKDFQISSNGGLAVDDSNIGFLKDMTQMEMLVIKGAPGLSDISVLAAFSNLYRLELVGCNINDVSPLAGLTNLKTLFLMGNPVMDFTPLSAIFDQLEEKDFEVISPNDVPEDPITFTDEWLEAAVRRAMNIHDRDITARDAYLLFSLDLSVAFNSPDPRIKSIAGLSYFTNLKELSFDFHEVTDLSPLAGLTKLERLSFNSNRVSDLSPLAGMNNLKGLACFGNQISDISVLAGKTDMVDLTIFSNQITDISPLAGLTKLGMLRMEGNQVSDISVLSEMKSLGILTLRDNPITDFSPVKDIYPQLWEKDFELN